MTLKLDIRQRAMLQAMGVQVWLPESGVATLEQVAQPAAARTPLSPTTLAQARANTAATVAAQSQRSPAPVPVARAPVMSPGGAAVVTAATSDTASIDWVALTDSVRNCQACALCAGRSNITLLAPTEQAPCDWMVLGDPPDEDEDRAGAPFAGQDGLLLANMLRALGLQRANPLPAATGARMGASVPSNATAQRVYVSNVLKCRPGTLPQAAQLLQCTVHLQHEIALVKPKLILGMGRFANQVLLAESPELAALPLGKLRGMVHSYQGIPVVLTYPPKLLMRNSADKAKAWADLCLAATKLDL